MHTALSLNIELQQKKRFIRPTLKLNIYYNNIKL